MTGSDRKCPECHCAMLEAIGHGWFYCNVCSARVLFDAAGTLVRVLLK